MSQNDFNLGNQGFPSMRADMNSAYQALASNSSGTSAPSTTYSNQWWYDETNGILKIRSPDNTSWITFMTLDGATSEYTIPPLRLEGVTATATQINTASTHYVPTGGIIMWSGSVLAIPTGWALCDGTDGTPNLQDRFVVGAGSSYAVGATGGATTVALSAAQMPQHRHYASVSGSTNVAGNHTHTYVSSINSGGSGTSSRFGEPTTRTTNPAGDHSHSVTAAGYTDYQGSSSAHENRPPYYALAYIMKT
jgi:microcystin-dependent protein